MKEASIKDTPVPIVLLLISFITPVELSFYLGGLHLTLTRIILIALAVKMTFRAGPPVKKQIHDYALIGFIIWLVIAISINHSVGKALESGGATALEVLISYFAARFYIRKISHIYGMLKLFSVITICLLPMFIIENITGSHFIHEIISSMTGVYYPIQTEHRMGLARAYGPFSHPILLGVFFSALLGIFWYGLSVNKKKRVWHAFILSLATFTSLSSAPMLVIVAQMFAIFWNKVASSMRYRWKIILAGILFLYVFLLFYSDSSPLMAILSRITLDSHSSYWRTLIWDYGSAEVIRNPFFGIGFGDWARLDWMYTASVDNFWLLQAMRYGLPAIIFLGVSVYLLMSKVNSMKDHQHLSEYKMISLGWLVSMISLILVGFTVDFFGNNMPYFFFILGLGAAIYNMQRVALKKHKANDLSDIQKLHI